jgi:hypothetical protein
MRDNATVAAMTPSSQGSPGSSGPLDVERFITNPSDYFGYSLEKMMSAPREQIAELQIGGLRRRFAQFRGALPMLDKLADSQNIHAVEDLEDVLPLLFTHATYKSYPPSLLDKHR